MTPTIDSRILVTPMLVLGLVIAASLTFPTPPPDFAQSSAASDYPDAIAAYSAELTKNPISIPAALGLADAYRHVHNYDEARQVLSRARRLHPRDAQLAKALGSLELEAQNWDAAIAALQIAVGAAPMDLEAHNFLGSAYQGKGDSTSALTQFNRVLARESLSRALEPDELRALELAHYLRAQVYADIGQDQNALTDAEILVQSRPNYLPGRELLAKILIRLQQCPRAVATLRPAENPPALDTQSLFLLGNAYDCAGQPDQAKVVRDQFAAASLADRTRAENETQSKHLVEQANDFARQNKLSEALDLVAQALDKNPQNAFAYAQQAKLYFSLRQPDRARAAINQALALEPYQPDFLYVSGILYAAAGNQRDALSAFETVTRINPAEADAFFEIGKIRLQEGDRRAARSAFQRAAQLDPSDPDYRQAVSSTNEHP